MVNTQSAVTTTTTATLIGTERHGDRTIAMFYYRTSLINYTRMYICVYTSTGTLVLENIVI